MGPKPTAVDQAGRPPRRQMAAPLRFETSASFGCRKASTLDAFNHLCDGHRAVGCDDATGCFMRDFCGDNPRRFLKDAGQPAGTSSTGHSSNVEGVNNRCHGYHCEVAVQLLLYSCIHSLAGVQPRRTREFATTLNEDKDIAAAANAGGNNKPVNGSMRPIAKGIPMRL